MKDSQTSIGRISFNIWYSSFTLMLARYLAIIPRKWLDQAS